jgi:hypothetical protein
VTKIVKDPWFLKKSALIHLTAFSPAAAYWNQRFVLRKDHSRIQKLVDAVGKESDLRAFQWAQLMAVSLEFGPDLVLELGRGKGNSTCAFTEASNLSKSKFRVLSLCLTNGWQRQTLPKLKSVVSGNWFEPLQAMRTDILKFDFQHPLSNAKRVLIFWDAHGFDVAECVLGRILPLVQNRDHLVVLHDFSDARYLPKETASYDGRGLWKGGNSGNRRLRIGNIDSGVEQSVSVLDFTTRNRIPLESAEQSFHTAFGPKEQLEMRTLLGKMFEMNAYWFYFSLNDAPGPYQFPMFEPPGFLKTFKNAFHIV